MSKICDICGKGACEYVKATAWWGKHLSYSDKSRKNQHWTAKIREDINQLTADICKKCTDDNLSNLIHFHQEVPEEVLNKRSLEERREKYPNESGLKSLRMTFTGGVEDIYCDICQKPCFEKHLKLKSEWQYPDQSHLTAYMCPECVSEHLTGQIKFSISG
ncbi:hypothetical protein [Anabaena sp. AL09]|jgi:hypothetical protein|uniref:hypothetical protein n=1 Tax=Anabaena sp. AL09 TaxID=1710891 RepID=UPI0007FDA2AC|nr:hypothetical protein [Anabaena sp. AL09]OBQ13807.1 MAG: hypothetical protein AN490_02105 [Anabaena sp. AL09]